MDIAAISKVANRKKINNETEKLREKLSRQTSDIVKLKVAQDTAYWDLKEKYQQLESNHAKLQQNMLDVQMQHETISGQYQDELRLRPDILNKIQTTRELATVLEQYSDRLKNTLSKCISDKNALSQAFNKSGALVKEMKNIQNNMDELYKRNFEDLDAKLKKQQSHHSQLTELYRAASKRDEEEISGLKAKLTSVTDVKDKIESELREEKGRGDRLKIEVENKERMITELQNNMRRLIHEVETQEKKMITMVAKLETDNKQYLEKVQSLETALKNQEQYTETVKSENNQLQEKISAVEDENQTLKTQVQQNELVIQESEAKIQKLTTDVSKAEAFRVHLEDIIQEQEKSLEQKSLELSTLKDKLPLLEKDLLETKTTLEDTSNIRQQLSEENEQLKEKVSHLEEMVAECTKNTQDMEKSYQEKIQALTTSLETKGSELSSTKDVLNRMLNDVSELKAQLGRADLKLKQAKEELKIKEDKIVVGEKANVALTDKLKDKDREMSKQISMILELRAEKDRFQTEIHSLNNTIDNIQKEVSVTTRRHRSPVLQAEMDDNAVTLTPKDVNRLKQPQKLCDSTVFTVPKSKEGPVKTLVYDFNSDNSVDGDFDYNSLLNRGSQGGPQFDLRPPAPKRRAVTPSRVNGGLMENPRPQTKKFFKSKKGGK